MFKPPGRLNLTDHYARLTPRFARAIVIDQDNVFNFTDGLKVSGQLIGDGSGITHIGSENLRMIRFNLKKLQIKPLILPDC